ncbi:MAG: DNA polymerase I [Bdellovibrionaceae bacterium]|nr:DNA polymerase I [Pseudobdellovibrionaceae bacterium]
MNSQSENKSVYLIDISSLFFRSYYAISAKMTNDKGLATNALYGTLKMIHQLIQKRNPDYMICCFDTKIPSFRKTLYQKYKANRSEMPEDLEIQVPHLKTMMNKLLIPCWEQEGFEADDLIASLVSFAKTKNWTSYIVSGDKDFAQIVDHNTFLYDTMKDVIYDPKGIEEKWGLPPSQMQDFLAITGDTSDNIPGVKGIGPKGAIQLLKTYKSLEEIYNNTNKLKDKLKEKLIKNKEQAFLSKQLVKLKEDIKWDKNFFQKNFQNISDFSEEDKQALKKFLEELSFKSFLKKFFPIKTESPKPFQESWKDDASNKPAKKSEKKAYILIKAKEVSIEEFKKNLEPYAQINIGSYEKDFYLSFKKNWTLLNKKQLKDLAEFLDYKWVRYSGHDLKFFWKILKVKNPIAEWDSILAGHLLSSEPGLPLRSLFYSYLSIPETDFLNPAQILYQEQKLKEKLVSQLEQEDMLNLYEEIELILISVLYEMEETGIRIDLKEISSQSQTLEKDTKELEFQIQKLAGEEFNLSSPKQLAEILFEKLNLPKGRKTKTGYSTDSHELVKIKKLHPIIPLVLEHRELFKLKSTYTDSLINLRNNTTGRIYTEFKQAVTATGRLSSVNPNLQNIPIRTERGQLIRKAFVSEKGRQLISADYSQLELRILAHITGDKNLQKAFEEDLDIHAITASELFNIPLKEVSSDLRRKSKAVNFGIAYGQGVYGLAETLSISRSEAKQIIENYFKKFKKIKEYIESVKTEIQKRNYVKTLYGRKRFFNKEELKHPRFRANVERAAINAPLQGTASDLVKKAMIELNSSLSIPILSQVHDELLFEGPEESLERQTKEIISIMEKNDVLKVPLKVNLATGKNWFIAHS